MGEPKICTVDGCERTRQYRLYCNPHYRRWRRNGNPGAADLRQISSAPDLCKFPGCDRLRRTAQLCGSHYLQKFKGRPLTPIRERSNPSVRDTAGRKQCTDCRSWLPTSDFYGNTGTKDRLTAVCRRCHRSAALLRTYGITLEQYEEMLAAQNGGCAICGGQNDDGRKLYVDHDHTTGAVRGLLCIRCNRAIGCFLDDPAHLTAAISYLQRSQHG